MQPFTEGDLEVVSDTYSEASEQDFEFSETSNEPEQEITFPEFSTGWHHPNCSAPNVIPTDGNASCASCGNDVKTWSQQDHISPPNPPNSVPPLPETPMRWRMGLNWPPSVQYQNNFDLIWDQQGVDLVDIVKRIEKFAEYTSIRDPAINGNELRLHGYKLPELPQDMEDISHNQARSSNADSSEKPSIQSTTASQNTCRPADSEVEAKSAPSHTHPVLESIDDVRLLHLSKGSPDDPIHGTLVSERLSELRNQRPGFEALSYTWSDGRYRKNTRSKTIFLGEFWTPFHVTSNCHAALLHLRLLGQDRILWVDSICINQDDVDERNHQVDLMHLIYASARNVAVFLSTKVLYQPLYPSENSPWNDRQKEDVKAAIDAIHDDEGQKDYNRLQPISRLAHDHYFERVWVIQEVAKAASATVYFDGGMIPFSRFAGAQMFHPTAIAKIPTWVSELYGKQYLPLHDLPKILAWSSDNQASDVRDKVFALLGLFRQSVLGQQTDQPLIPANYSISVSQLNTGLSAFFACLENFDFSDILAPAHGISSSRFVKEPSWVLPWLNARHWTNPYKHTDEDKLQATSWKYPNQSMHASYLQLHPSRIIPKIHRNTGTLLIEAVEIMPIFPLSMFRLESDRERGIGCPFVLYHNKYPLLSIWSKNQEHVTESDGLYLLAKCKKDLAHLQEVVPGLFRFVGTCSMRLSSEAESGDDLNLESNCEVKEAMLNILKNQLKPSSHDWKALFEAERRFVNFGFLETPIGSMSVGALLDLDDLSIMDEAYSQYVARETALISPTTKSQIITELQLRLKFWEITAPWVVMLARISRICRRQPDRPKSQAEPQDSYFHGNKYRNLFESMRLVLQNHGIADWREALTVKTPAATPTIVMENGLKSLSPNSEWVGWMRRLIKALPNDYRDKGYHGLYELMEQPNGPLVQFRDLFQEMEELDGDENWLQNCIHRTIFLRLLKSVNGDMPWRQIAIV